MESEVLATFEEAACGGEIVDATRRDADIAVALTCRTR